MKLVSWNVNGLRACIQKGFPEFFEQIDADIFCVQETKMLPEQMPYTPQGYIAYWNSAQKKGYSGTAVFTKIIPLSVRYELPEEEHGGEGRVITLEYERFYLVNVYTPNAKRELERLDYRMEWEDAFRRYVSGLDQHKPVVICGDLNVAHREIDLKNYKSNTKNAGFTPQEREKFSRLLDAGFIDSFRTLYPDRAGAYTWWSYMGNARANNAGWRIDYFVLSQRLAFVLRDSIIMPQVEGSDHCPVVLDIF